jgi:hypothetical protein
VRVTTAIQDDAGNPMAADFRWEFTTGGTETTPPTLVSVTPSANATQVPVGQIIEALFSEAIDCSTIRTGQGCSLASSGGLTTCTEVWWTESVPGTTGLDKTIFVFFEPVTGEVSRVDCSHEPRSDFSWAWGRHPSLEPITTVVVDRAAGQVTFTDLVMAPSTRPVGVSNPPPVKVNGVLLYP